MTIQERTFTGSDGRELFYRAAVPDNPRAIFIIVHGFGEHSGRYLNTMTRLAEAGYASYTMDLRGFGRNTRVPAYVPSIEPIVGDLHLLTGRARDELAGPEQGPESRLPAVILGHSMGGLLALKQLLHHQDDYALAITSGPAILPPDNTSPLVISMARVLSALLPYVPISSMGKEKGTRNEEQLERDRHDPLFYDGGFRARTGYRLLQTQLEVRQRLPEITIPILALHGEGDLLMNPRATEILCDEIGSTDKTKVIFPVLYHEVLNEPEREMVFQKIFQWIDERLAG